MGNKQTTIDDNQYESDLKSAKERARELKQKLNYHGQKYYEDDNPEIEDYQYDKLYRELETLELKYPELIETDSPTQKVGGQTSGNFNKVYHDVPMKSLMDVFDYAELIAFDAKVKQVIGQQVEYVVEKKIDGLSVSLEYRNGNFTRGSTRGDGIVGEDVTDNLKTMPSIPKRLQSDIEYIEVRGEVFMPRHKFLEINEKQVSLGQPVFANPRNAAAGSLRQLNSEVTAQRGLDIYIFNIQQISGYQEINKHSDGFCLLDSLGFKVVPNYKVVSNIEEAINVVEEIHKERNNLEFDIDGAVIKVNLIKNRLLLGETSKAPRWAVAYKYPAEKKQTVIKDIWVNVGRTGILTPNAVLESVEIAGTTVSRATLHNMDYIRNKDIRIGDTAIIQKAGDIIPEVVEIVKEKRVGEEQEFIMPDECPKCGGNIIRDGVAYKCINMNCGAQIFRNIVHFVSRDAMNIEGLGPSIVEMLLERGFITSVADLYYLHIIEEKLIGEVRLGKKSVRNLIESIERSKKNNIDKLIYGFGIPNVGLRAAQILSQRFNTIEDVSSASVEDIIKLHEFGEKTALSIVNFFKQQKVKEMIEKLKNAGVNIKSRSDNKLKGSLVGLTFVVTGSFETHSRSEITKLIEEHGGKVSSSVSKNTNFVLAGEAAGSKLKKAEELKIKVISLKDFEHMLIIREDSSYEEVQ